MVFLYSSEYESNECPVNSFSKCPNILYACTSGSEASFGGPRVTVFILGGVTFTEMKAAYDVTKQMNRQVIIGMSTAPGTVFSDTDLPFICSVDSAPHI